MPGVMTIHVLSRLLLRTQILAVTALLMASTGNAYATEPVAPRYYVDVPQVEIWEEVELEVAGWIWAQQGDPIERVALQSGAWSVPVPYGLERNDVAVVLEDPAAALSGFHARAEVPIGVVTDGIVSLVAYRESGTRVLLKNIRYEPARISAKWHAWLKKFPQWKDDPFWLIPGTSGVSGGDDQGFMEAYGDYQSDTLRVGLRVPVLYMRTTEGGNADWQFSSNPRSVVLENGRLVADDWLRGIMDLSREHQLPILFTLNGGVWGDAYSAGPEHDLIDHLELDSINCQWDQNDRVYPDGIRKDLPGSMPSPELSRMLTLNALNEPVRRYKKRNLQAAGRALAVFASEFPRLFVGINLDADLYLSPFVKGSWHDFNPQTLEQFRQWLRGAGLYAVDARLDQYREQSLSLEEVNLIAGKSFSSWEEVDPPREAPLQFLPSLAEDPWMKLWERFRRHLVALHYDDMSLWLMEAGVAQNKIFSSQAFIESRRWVQPFAERLDSPIKNFDSAGVSVEGAKPAFGHLGVIVYGRSATNEIDTESGRSAFRVFYETDPDWAIIEHSTADFRDPPKRIPPYADGYRSLRDAFNFHARMLSPMAWNGNNGDSVDQSWFHAHTAFRDTPMEVAVKDFLREYAYLPRKALYWGFGNRRHSDADGWVTEAERHISWAEGGRLRWHHPEGEALLISPEELALNASIHRALVLGTRKRGRVRAIGIDYLDAGDAADAWQELAPMKSLSTMESGPAGLTLALDWPPESRPVRLRFRFDMREQGETAIDHIAIFPTGMRPNVTAVSTD